MKSRSHHNSHRSRGHPHSGSRHPSAHHAPGSHHTSHHRTQKHPRHWRRSRKTLYWIGGVILILFGIRLALPHAVKYYVNRQLNKSPTYSGHVGNIDLSLWRGAYEIRDINISKRNGKINVPFFSAPLMDLSIQWNALFHHRIVAKVYMEHPQLNFVKGPTPQQTQAGEKTQWNQMLENLIPFKMDRLDVHEGQIHYRDDYSTPKVDIYFKELGASATNLSNIRNKKIELPAGIRAHAVTIGNGQMSFHLQFNPTAPAPEYQLQASLTNVNLPALNDFFKAYGKFNVAHGRFAMFTSVAATNRAYEGYIKVLFRNLDVFEWKKERSKSIAKIFWEAVVGTVATILKNQPKDQLATKIPISGVYSNSQVDLTTTVVELLRNAFIRALLPKFDQKITTTQVTKNVKHHQVPHANNNGAPKKNRGNNGPPVRQFPPAAGIPKPATRLESPALPLPPPKSRAVNHSGASPTNQPPEESSPRKFPPSAGRPKPATLLESPILTNSSAPPP